MIKAIGFDLGDTLIEYASIPLSWEQEYSSALEKVAAALSVDFTRDNERSAVEILRKYNTRLNPRTNEVGAEHIFSEILLAWNLGSAGLLPSVVDSFFGHFRQKLQPFPDAALLLKELERRDIRYGVLTDVPYGMPREYVLSDISGTGLTVPDSCVLTSLETGRRKPDPKGIEALANLLGSNVSEFVYVGNERKDIEAARNADSKAVLIWRSNFEIPDWGQDLTLHKLDDLSSLLDEASFT